MKTCKTPEQGGGIKFVNFLLYIICVTSLGASVYLNFRQTHLEDRIRHLRHIDDRVTILEAKLQNIIQPFAQKLSATSSATAGDEFTDVANVVRKLSLQVAGIQRLRRDVSHLQFTRRSNRQASVQQSPECVCPAGKVFFFIFLHYSPFICENF